jgi:hypothetical protein
MPFTLLVTLLPPIQKWTEFPDLNHPLVLCALLCCHTSSSMCWPGGIYPLLPVFVFRILLPLPYFEKCLIMVVVYSPLCQCGLYLHLVCRTPFASLARNA